MTRARARSRDLEQAIGHMSGAHVYCRDFGHAWEPWTAHRIQRGGYEQVLRCQRCHTQRRRLLDRRGEVVRSGYDYADGYLVTGLGRLTGSDRGILRVASLEQTIETRPGVEQSA